MFDDYEKELKRHNINFSHISSKAKKIKEEKPREIYKAYVPDIPKTNQMDVLTNELEALRVENGNLKKQLSDFQGEMSNFEDEFSMFKRKYEDLIYNLDDDNLSEILIKEKDKMKAEIKVNADKIATKVSNEELKTYSTIEQTAQNIATAVTRYADLGSAIEINDIKTEATDVTKIYAVKNVNAGGEIIGLKYFYYNNVSKNWEPFNGDSIYSVFQQTTDGFKMKGNVVIDGNQVITKDLVLQGNIRWDTTNTPIQSVYSNQNAVAPNSTNIGVGKMWHNPILNGDKYISMSFDGCNVWSGITQIVGTNGINGVNGANGLDANVSDVNVFNALTGGGKFQGVFVDNGGKLYINANYINGGTIQGVTINVNTDMSIGRKLNLMNYANTSFPVGAEISIYDDSSLLIKSNGGRSVTISSQANITIINKAHSIEIKSDGIYFDGTLYNPNSVAVFG